MVKHTVAQSQIIVTCLRSDIARKHNSVGITNQEPTIATTGHYLMFQNAIYYSRK